MPWFDIEEAYFTSSLSSEPLQIWHSIKENNADTTGINLLKNHADIPKLCSDFEFAEFSKKNEVIALYSEQLARLKGSFRTEVKIRWSGYDPVCLGEWSLLRDGFFAAPDAFANFADSVNRFGLFEKEDAAYKYAQAYFAAAKQDVVEEMDEEQCDISCVRVGVVPWMVPRLV